MIADHDLAFEWVLAKVDASGGRDLIHVRIGTPRYRQEPFPVWRCAFTVEGYFDRETEIFGATALQALSLALKVLREVLRGVAAETALVEAGTAQPLNDQTLADLIH